MASTKITQWKRIKIPAEAYDHVKERAKARRMAMWQYILSTINFYESAMRQHAPSDATKLQNNAWYAVKLTAAVTEFIHRPNEEKYNNVMKIIGQIETRKHVDLSDLKALIGMYRERRKKSIARAMLQVVARVFVSLSTTQAQ